MTNVSIQRLSKQYSAQSHASLKGLSMDINSGELIALLGPSGCGKTTALKILAGLMEPSSGDIRFDAQSVLKISPDERGAVMVFQNNLLFPYMSVAENIGFGLKMRHVSKPEIARRVDKMLEMVKLPGYNNRKPAELSGGQQQRVALARALIIKPKVLLLDEPLSSLDTHLRVEMRELIRELHRALKMTTVFVTHDQEEAVVLADRVALILEGRMTQYDKPEAFFKAPADVATARFFGGVNFFPGEVINGVFKSGDLLLEAPKNTALVRGIMTFRPENVRICNGDSVASQIKTTLRYKQYLGTQTRLVLSVAGSDIEALVNPSQAEGLTPGDIVKISVPSKDLCLLEAS